MTTTSNPHPKHLPLLVALIIALHALLALSAANTKSAAFDEPIHLIGGYTYWLYNDYRIHAENGNLAQRIIALPDAILPGFPHTAGPSNLSMDNDPEFQRGSGYTVAWNYLFADHVDHHTLIFRARAMVTLASCALALVVFLTAQRLFGTPAGLVSLCAYAFNPIILANAALMTSDLLAALFFTLTTWALWACLHKLTPLRLIGLTFSAAAMALTKFSFPLFFPIALAITLITLIRNRPWPIHLPPPFNSSSPSSPSSTRTPKPETRNPHSSTRLTSRSARLLTTLALSALVTLGVWAIVWAAYGFRYHAAAPGIPGPGLLFNLGQMLPELGLPGKILAFFASLHLLPEAFLYGMAHVYKFSKGRLSLVCGEYYQSGTWWFYPACLFFKSPLSFLTLFLVSLAGIASFHSSRLKVKLYNAAPWLALAIIFLGLAMVSPLNIGVRHVLPALVPITILLGYAAYALRPKPKLQKTLLTALCLALAAQAALAWPNYISHFNTLAGPRENLYTKFADSNLDWGQDLPDLAAWAKTNLPTSPDGTPLQPLFVSYFGSAKISAYGVNAINIRCYFPQPDEPLPPIPYAPGTYAISATLLSLYPAHYGPTWSDFLDKAYIQRRDFFIRFFASQPGSPERAQIQGSLTRQQIGEALKEFEDLRFCRLCAFLRQQKPLAQINSSINIYNITQEDLQRYFLGPTPGNGPLIHDLAPQSRVDLPTN